MGGTPETTPTQPTANITYTDAPAAKEFFCDFHRYYEKYFDHNESELDKRLDINKQVSAFHERLMLLDLGTIALSVTALSSLGPKLHELAHAQKVFIIVATITGWVLLLLSVFLCRAVMISTIGLNRFLFDAWKRTSMKYFLDLASIQTSTLANLTAGTLTINNQTHDVSEFMRSIASQARKTTEELQLEMKNEADKSSETAKTVGGLSTIAISSMQFGLICFCISAVKILLSF